MSDFTGSKQLGERLHKALRQACDSQATFLVWHLLNIPEENVQKLWRRYLDRVFSRVENLDNNDMRAIILKDTVAEFTALQHGDAALQTALQMIPTKDWQILASYAEPPRPCVADGVWDMATA